MTTAAECLELCTKCVNFKRATDDMVDCLKRPNLVRLAKSKCPLGRWTGPDHKPRTKKNRHHPAEPTPIESRPAKARLYNVNKEPLDLAGLYAGRSAFLILSGPSFGLLDHDKLRQPGILTMGANNSPATFRPDMWTYVDPPCKWLRSTWFDPKVMKFACLRHRGSSLFDSDAWKELDAKVRDCPNVWYYERNADKFDPAKYLTQSTFWWGQSGKTRDDFSQKGGRSVMLLAIRLLHFLGVRRVFLLGADFHMDEEHKYHFDQDRSKGSIRGNNATYKKMNLWFRELRPHFEKAGFNVFNCNPDSKLTAFDTVEYDKAVQMCLDEFGNVDTSAERTAGLYERDKGKKRMKQAIGKGSYEAEEAATARVRSPKTGKVYRAKATATAVVEAEANGEGATKFRSRVNAETNACMKAFFEATVEAKRLAKEKATAAATLKMDEAEKGVAA